MIRFVADEIFDNLIICGLWRLKPDLDIVRVQDLEIAGADDDTVLEWAAHAKPILLTQDQHIVPAHAYERMRRGEAVAGVIVVSDRQPLGLNIQDILIIAEATSPTDWVNQIQRLPL
jgi:Domain of unknown function (DUF5615)